MPATDLELDLLIQFIDIPHFGRRRCGFRCDRQQSDLFRHAGSRVLLNCSRQSGKSTITALKAVHCAFFRPNSTVVVTAPIKQQTREFIRKVRNLAALGESAKSGDKFSVLFHNGSRIVGVAANEDTIRSFSSVALDIVDEAARVADDVYYSLLPMLAVSGGSLWILSTPKGKRGFFHQEWAKPEADTKAWIKFSVKAEDCPRIPTQFLEEQKVRMGARRYAQEYECLFVELDRGVFDPDVVQKAFRKDVKPYTEFDL